MRAAARTLCDVINLNLWDDPNTNTSKGDMNFLIRPYHDDARACAEVYFHAVQRGTHEKYTKRNKCLGAKSDPDLFSNETCIVAEAMAR